MKRQRKNPTSGLVQDSGLFCVIDGNAAKVPPHERRIRRIGFWRALWLWLLEPNPWWSRGGRK